MTSINTISQSNQRWFSKSESFSYFGNLETKIRINICLDILKKYIVTSGKQPKLLDVGCGDGRIAESIGKLTKFKVYGVEVSSQNVALAKKRGVIATQSDIATKLPYKSNYFDFVFAGEIIEHIFDTELFLKEINRVLKPNGHLIVTTPNLAHLPDRLRMLRGLNPSNVSPIHPFLHLHIRPFSFNMLEYALHLFGFKLFSLQSTLVVFKWTNAQVRFSSRLLAKIWPTLGNTLIVDAQKTDK